MAANKLLQANLNRARAAQALLEQYATEHDYGLMVVSEPHWVPPRHSQWAAARRGSEVDVAITWRRSENPLPCTFLEAGSGYVVVRWGDMAVIGVYLSPNLSHADFENRLGLDRCVRKYASTPTIVAGDFNSWSTSWGSRHTNRRDVALETWAASLGLYCMNTGSTSTCVRPQGGESVIDLTWANPQAAARIRGWSVLTDAHTESDHRYIGVVLTETPAQVLGRRQPRSRRWALRKFTENPFEEYMLAGTWPAVDDGGGGNVDERAERIRALLIGACDAAMPLTNPRPRRAAHWWSDELTTLRQEAHAKRRVLKRARRCRGTDPAAIEEAAIGYRGAAKALRAAIARAKAEAWKELLQTLDEDPWGRPYKIVREKLRRWAPPHTEALEAPVLARVLGALFPESTGEVSPWVEQPATEEE